MGVNYIKSTEEVELDAARLLDDELQALQLIYNRMRVLDVAARQRVTDWVVARLEEDDARAKREKKT